MCVAKKLIDKKLEGIFRASYNEYIYHAIEKIWVGFGWLRAIGNINMKD